LRATAAIRCIARSASTSGGPMHGRGDIDRSVDWRSTLLRSSAATNLVAVILVVDHPVALVELLVEAVQGLVIVVPELLPAFFFFAAVVTDFIGASPESVLRGTATVATAIVITWATEISLGNIAGH